MGQPTTGTSSCSPDPDPSTGVIDCAQAPEWPRESIFTTVPSTNASHLDPTYSLSLLKLTERCCHSPVGVGSQPRFFMSAGAGQLNQLFPSHLGLFVSLFSLPRVHRNLFLPLLLIIFLSHGSVLLCPPVRCFLIGISGPDLAIALNPCPFCLYSL